MHGNLYKYIDNKVVDLICTENSIFKQFRFQLCFVFQTLLLKFKKFLLIQFKQINGKFDDEGVWKTLMITRLSDTEVMKIQQNQQKIKRNFQETLVW